MPWQLAKFSLRFGWFGFFEALSFRHGGHNRYSLFSWSICWNKFIYFYLYTKTSQIAWTKYNSIVNLWYNMYQFRLQLGIEKTKTQLMQILYSLFYRNRVVFYRKGTSPSCQVICTWHHNYYSQHINANSPGGLERTIYLYF